MAALHTGMTSWIGISSCAFLVVWSIILRLVERHCLEKMPLQPDFPQKPDAALFLGRRNLCFVLEGCRKDILTWTGTGLRQQEVRAYSRWDILARLGSTLLLIYIFITVLNGTTLDQVAFICFNIVAQLNVVIGQRLNGRLCLASFDRLARVEAATRTHVYAFLVKRLGNGPWVEATSPIPTTSIWQQWKDSITDSDEDPKQLYGRIAGEAESKAAPVLPTVKETVRPGGL